MLREDPAYADKAARVSALAKDITEYLAGLDAPAVTARAGLTVAYHSACSMQHGQKIDDRAEDACCKRAGFAVKDVPEGHLCCGSAGTYNMLQPEISGRLRARKVANIASDAPRHHRDRQYRLHDADRGRRRGTDRPHRRAARLGLWRSEAVSDPLTGVSCRSMSRSSTASSSVPAGAW